MPLDREERLPWAGSRDPLPGGWPEELKEHGTQIPFIGGKRVHTQGKDADQVRLVTEGLALSICEDTPRDTTDEGSYIADVYSPGDILGLMAFYDGSRHYEDTVEVPQFENLRTLTLPHTVFNQILGNNPLARQLIRQQISRQRANIAAQAALTMVPSPRRVDLILRKLARRLGTQSGDKVSLNLALTNAEIAHMIGSTPETVSRRIAELIRQKVLKRGKGRGTGIGLIIDDVSKLGT